MLKNLKLLNSANPHIKKNISVQTLRWNMILSLLPIMIASFFFFHWLALKVISISIFSCIFFNKAACLIRKTPHEIEDGKAILSGLLIAFILPPTLPWWVLIIGAFIFMALIQEFFYKKNWKLFNSLMITRVILQLLFPIEMTQWVSSYHLVTTATPLWLISEGLSIPNLSYSGLFFGSIAGSLGETSKFAILLGGGFLIFRKIISFQIPFYFLLALIITSSLLGRAPVLDVLTGGAFFAAFYVITEKETGSYTKMGQCLFALIAGILCGLFRQYLPEAEGMAWAVLLSNLFVPAINLITTPKPYGTKK